MGACLILCLPRQAKSVTYFSFLLMVLMKEKRIAVDG